MKENKYIYFLLFILGIFCFNSDVYAAQELTCVYKKKSNSDKVMLIQYSDGTRKIYKNEKDVDADANTWYLSNASANNIYGVKLDSDGNLLVCPEEKRTSTKYKGRVYFTSGNAMDGETHMGGDCDLENSYFTAKKGSSSSNSSSSSESSNSKYEAQELSCLYQKKFGMEKVWLIQYKDGTRKIYKHEKDATIGDSGWRLSSAGTDNWYGIIADSQGNLSFCPEYSRISTIYEGRVYFYTSKLEKDAEGNSGTSKLEWSAVQTGTSSNSNSNTSNANIAQELTCLYKKNAGAVKDIFKKSEKVLLIQYSDGTRKIFKNEKDVSIEDTGWKISSASPNNFYGIELDNNGNLTKCPTYKRTSSSHLGRVYFYGDEFAVDPELGTGNCELEAYQEGVIEPTISTTPVDPIELPDLPDNLLEENSIEVCNDILTEGGELQKILKGLVTAVKILVPIALFVLGVLDFVQAIFANNEDNMKKATNKFIRRLLIAVIIFLLPTIIHLILEIASKIWPNISSDFCGIL